MPWSQAARDQATKADAEADVRQEATGYGVLQRPVGEVG